MLKVKSVTLGFKNNVQCLSGHIQPLFPCLLVVSEELLALLFFSFTRTALLTENTEPADKLSLVNGGWCVMGLLS